MALLLLDSCSLLDQTQILFLRTLLITCPQLIVLLQITHQRSASMITSSASSKFPLTEEEHPHCFHAPQRMGFPELLPGGWLSCGYLLGGPRVTPRYLQHVSIPRKVGLLPSILAVTERGTRGELEKMLQKTPLMCTWDFPGGPMVRASPCNAGGVGLTPGQGTKIPHASWPRNQDIKPKQCCNRFSKDLKMVYIKKIFFKMLKNIICVSLTGTLGDNGRMVGCSHGNTCPISLTWPQFW